MTYDMPHLTKRGYSTNTAFTRFHKELLNEYLYGAVHALVVIFLNGWILPIGGVASGRVCACSLRSRLVSQRISFLLNQSMAKVFVENPRLHQVC